MFKVVCAGLLLGSSALSVVPHDSSDEAFVFDARYRRHHHHRRAAAQVEEPAQKQSDPPFPNDVIWKCTSGKGKTQMDLTAHASGKTSGEIFLPVTTKEKAIRVPLDFEYVRKGASVYVYKTSIELDKGGGTQLPRMVPRKKLVVILDWNSRERNKDGEKKIWDATLGTTTVKMKCEE